MLRSVCEIEIIHNLFHKAIVFQQNLVINCVKYFIEANRTVSICIKSKLYYLTLAIYIQNYSILLSQIFLKSGSKTQSTESGIQGYPISMAI